MNLVVLMGRTTKKPEVKSTGESLIAKYTLAVDRIGEGADFINCTAFGKQAEFADKFLDKGTKIIVVGRINTGSYENKEGNKVYTTDVVVNRHEFCESKQSGMSQINAPIDFVDIPEGIPEELPFN